MPIREWIKSADFAIEGILHAARTQRHLRYHFYSAAMVLLASYIFGVSRTEFIIISLSVIAVLLSEMFNTAIEGIIDIISPNHSEKARIVKDIAAGAVLVTVFGAAVVGYIVLSPYIRDIFYKGLYIAKHSKEEISIISFIIILILVVVTKVHFGKGHPLRGGMPSGHAALAFSAWISVTFMAANFTASLLAFILAAIIARSRVITKVHTWWEVVLGSLMGAVVTLLLFRIFL